MEKIEGDYYAKRPDVKVGDTVKLSMKIAEGDKERIQVFEGIIIAIKGEGMGKTITVRKISYGIGVERVVPMNSPKLDKIEVVKRGSAKRSKLYFMRERIGKLAMKIRGSEFVDANDAQYSDAVDTPEITEEGGVDAKDVAEDSSDDAKSEDVMTKEKVDAAEDKENANKAEDKKEEKA